MDICFLVTTYNRSFSCHSLCSQLQSLGDVYIVDDCSDEGYDWARNGKFGYHRNSENNGKAKFWKTISNLWSMAKLKNYDYYFVIQDDCVIDPKMVEKAVYTWERIEDPKKMCLNLWVSRSRLDKVCWTETKPTYTPYAMKTQWTDMAAFMCTKSFFKFFNWKIPELTPKTHMSSGVGMYISQSLHKAGYSIYQCHTTLVYPSYNAKDSKMNSWRTKQENELLHDMVSGVIRVQLASIPSRIKSLEMVVESLKGQANELIVALNGYKETPSFLDESQVIHLDNKKGDAGKFYDADKHRGYFITADDDIIYPDDYVQRLILNIHKHKAIATWHGRVFKKPYSGFNAFSKVIRFNEDNREPVVVDIGGTGVMGYHTDIFNISYDYFEHPNMADVWVAKKAHEDGIKIVAIPHLKGEAVRAVYDKSIHEERKEQGWDIENKILAGFLNQPGVVYHRKQRINFMDTKINQEAAGVILSQSGEYCVVKHRRKGFWTRSVVHVSLIAKP